MLFLIGWDLFFFYYMFLGTINEQRHPWSSLSLLRVYRFRKAFLYLRDWETDLDAKYYWRGFVRVVEIIIVTYSWVHAEGCIFYYISEMEKLHGCPTWLGCLQMGPYGYHHFSTLTVGGRYLISIYYAMITIFTIGNIYLVTHDYNINLLQILLNVYKNASNYRIS